MYQGLMITIIYCFTNKEVNMVLKTFYDRYRLQHTSQHELRRGSRSIASHYQARNGQMTGVLSYQFAEIHTEGVVISKPCKF
ncbi:unnamed protein product [Strongylus vulgaris]|uniref:G-protein coupled receptors family 2 profile 2 domain-containing protein n=1 Tax=Strongylus vulgaris TaxID=40348 RepID=A0A3P7IRC4_STRVU|nr:unnamed protein product [Strongylus vulgaris]